MKVYFSDNEAPISCASGEELDATLDRLHRECDLPGIVPGE